MGPPSRIARRYELLLSVNQVALSNFTPENVFEGACRALKQLVPYDRAGLSLYDPDQDALRIVSIHGPHENSMFRVGHLLNRKTSQTGWVFENKTPLFRRDLARELRFPADKHVVDEGYGSLCSVPLIVRGDSIGVLTVVGAKRNQLSLQDAELVEEVGNQIALAISSMMPRCASHTSTRLICPRCIGAAGGKITVSKHRDDLSTWGRKGGRGRKNLTNFS
jgi:formate hydrogenlyase transcriptional activator